MAKAAIESERMVSAECRLCEARVERDEAAVVGEHLVCGPCCARVGVQARPVLKRMIERRRREVSPALGLAVAYAEVCDGRPNAG